MNTKQIRPVMLKSMLHSFLIIASLLPISAIAEEPAENLLSSDPQKLARGIGHFERSRSLLLAAIREFDSGYTHVKTDQVMDAEAWRKTLLLRAQELETILSPKPREIQSGSRYAPDSRLLGAKVKPPANLKANQPVKKKSESLPEAKEAKPQIDSKETIDLEVSGS